jgi:hypothetical protein
VAQADLSGLGLSAEESKVMGELADVDQFFTDLSSNILDVVSG